MPIFSKAVFRQSGTVRSGLVALFPLFAAAFALGAAAAPAGQVGQRAEWDAPRLVLMHSPGDEVFMGILHPAAALFEKPLNLTVAEQQHLRYIERLRGQGAEVYRVVDLLLRGTVDKGGEAVPGPDLDALRAFAADSLTFDASTLAPDEQSSQVKYKAEVLASLAPQDLVDVIIHRPVLHLKHTGINTGLSAVYEETPVMNLYFLRDQMITTAKGVVMSRLNSVQRAPEPPIIKFALKKLGITPIYEVTGDGRLEGGDFFPAGDIAFIGQGLRTNAEGIRQLLDHQVFGTPRVAVVKDDWLNQEEMHLDTYFNIIGPRLAVMVDLRMDVPGREPEVKGVHSRVDLYQLGPNGYTLEKRDMDFQQFLEKDLGFTVIPVSRRDQNLYGVNFLTYAPGKVFAIDGVSAEYKQALRKNGVDAVWMDFDELTKGYGAAHCTTQVLRRVPAGGNVKKGGR